MPVRGQWYERLYARLHMPLWAGGLVFAALPFLLAAALAFAAAGLWDAFLAQLVPFYLPFAALLIVTAYLTRHASARVEGLREYADAMNGGTATVDTARLYSIRAVLLTWVLLLVTVNPLYILSADQTYTPAQVLVTTVAPWPYALLFASSFLWVWVYSMFLLYKMGRAPLTLRPFTEDSLLGLRPFARTSLRLAGIYLAVIAVIALPQILTGYASLLVTLMFVGFLLLGIALFLLPLLPLRRKLRAAKAEESGWIGFEYSRVVQSCRGLGDALDEKVAARLMAIDKIQRDVRQIRSWPFEPGILARLVAVVLSVTAIILSQFLARFLNL